MAEDIDGRVAVDGRARWAGEGWVHGREFDRNAAAAAARRAAATDEVARGNQNRSDFLACIA